MKNVRAVRDAPQPHWVGDGFPVRSLFSYHADGEAFSPFLLLDRAGPADFPPAVQRRGVGPHPHRGFETVTIVYQGEVAHRDSTGQGGVIGPGEVQWMTAASGIVHEEFHSEAFTRSGGTLDMVQLWVNLPARHKMAKPGYQAIAKDAIPNIDLAAGAGTLRVIAGNYAGHSGPARTSSPLNVWDMRLVADKRVDLPAPEGWNAMLVVLRGTVQVNDVAIAREAQVVSLTRAGSGLSVEANGDAALLLLAGQPLAEPVVGHGPFVMNTREEIVRAIEDYNNGLFGQMPT